MNHGYRSHFLLPGIVAVLFAAFGCGRPTLYSAQAGDEQRASSAAQTKSEASGPSRDLSADEAAGGHTLKRHVGRSDDDLHQRLAHERISAASSYTDRATAEHAVGSAIASNKDRIQSWLSRSGGHPNLVLDFDSPRPIGRTLYRDEARSAPCSHSVVVLKWRPPADYYVLTSYPECKP